MKTHKLIKHTVVSIVLLSAVNIVFAADCSEDEAYGMYAKINDHAASLKADAKANPSKIPFQSGKNDPRLKKSIKISGKTKKINADHLATKDYGKACDSLAAVAKKHKISLGDDSAAGLTVKDGLKAAGHARSLKSSLNKD